MASTLKTSYGSSAALTITLASLATSSNKIVGRESTAVDNTTTLALDYLVSGKITTGTSPTTGKTIDVWVGALADDTTWPGVLDGTDSDETFADAPIRNATLALACTMVTNATSDTTYWFKAFSVAQLFGGVLPKKFVVFVTHDTAVNLNSTAGNHAIWATPVFAQTV